MDKTLPGLTELRRRGRFVVVGGPYASLCPEEWRGRCDVLFVDEAEETWPAFVRDFEAGTWETEYRAAEKPHLSAALTPRFDLLKVDRYHALTINSRGAAPSSASSATSSCSTAAARARRCRPR